MADQAEGALAALQTALRELEREGVRTLTGSLSQAPQLLVSLEACLTHGVRADGHWWDCVEKALLDTPQDDAEEAYNAAREARGEDVCETREAKTLASRTWLLRMLETPATLRAFLTHVAGSNLFGEHYEPTSLLGTRASDVASALVSLDGFEAITFDLVDVKLFTVDAAAPPSAPSPFSLSAVSSLFGGLRSAGTAAPQPAQEPEAAAVASCAAVVLTSPREASGDPASGPRKKKTKTVKKIVVKKKKRGIEDEEPPAATPAAAATTPAAATPPAEERASTPPSSPSPPLPAACEAPAEEQATVEASTEEAAAADATPTEQAALPGSSSDVQSAPPSPASSSPPPSPSAAPPAEPHACGTANAAAQTEEAAAYLCDTADAEEVRALLEREEAYRLRLAEYRRREAELATREETVDMLTSSKLKQAEAAAQEAGADGEVHYDADLTDAENALFAHQLASRRKAKELMQALGALQTKVLKDGGTVKRDVMKKVGLVILAATSEQVDDGRSDGPHASGSGGQQSVAADSFSDRGTALDTCSLASGSFRKSGMRPSASAASLYDNASLAATADARTRPLFVVPQGLVVEEPIEVDHDRQLAMQGHQCPGCGVNLNKRSAIATLKPNSGWVRVPRRCRYNGKLYCRRCHTNKELPLPAKIVRWWDFRPYKVSQPSYSFLKGIESEPLIHIGALNPALYRKVPRLAQSQKYREKLQKCLEIARTADDTLLRDDTHEYLLSSSEVYSLRDLALLHGKEHQTFTTLLSSLQARILNFAARKSALLENEMRLILDS